MQFELSPKGVLFASYTYNPNDECDGISGDPIPCNQTGIQYSASIEAGKGWTGKLNIPMKLIDTVPTTTTATATGLPILPANNNNNKKNQGNDDGTTQLRANMFRIDQVSANSPRQFSAWSPTFFSPACFHVPKYFGVFSLK